MDMLPQEPQLPGYIFSHWSTSPDGAPFNIRDNIYDEINLYAIWIPGEAIIVVEDNDDSYDYDTEDEYEYDYYDEDGPGYEYDEAEYSDEENDYIGDAPFYSYENEYSYDYDYDESYGYVEYAYDNGDEAFGGYLGYAPDYVDFSDGYDVYSDYNEYGYAQALGVSANDNEEYSSYYENYGYGYEYALVYEEYDYEIYASDYEYHDYESYDVVAERYDYESIEAMDEELLYGLYEGDDITVYFRYNRGGQWEGPYVRVNVDNRGNIAVAPAQEHMVILDGDYVYVRFPEEIYTGDFGISLPQTLDWSYSIRYDTVEREDLPLAEEYYEYKGFEIYTENYRTYTYITIRHDILSRITIEGEIIYLYVDEPGDDFGFMPFAINYPLPFNHVPLAFPYDNAAWITAINNAVPEYRVISVPNNSNLTSVVTITGNRHVIITTTGTNLNNGTTNHTFGGTPSVITHNGATGRHFTVGSGWETTTLTLSHIVLCGNFPTPATSPQRGGVTVQGMSNFHMLAGSIIRYSRFSGGGGVNLAGTTGLFTMTGNSSIANNFATSNGGGLLIAGARSAAISDTSSIINNSTFGHGGGVALTAVGASLTMTGGSISNNTASDLTIHTGNSHGGGVAITTSSAVFTMSGGTISGNTALGSAWASAAAGPGIGHGAGVWIAAGAGNLFTMTGGTISNNTATGGGGGIFTSEPMLNVYGTNNYPQLDIAAAAIFNGNQAGLGSVNPPAGIDAQSGIPITAQRSGGYWHPLNNLDINFDGAGDWALLNSVIVNLDVDYIIIHPTGSSQSPGIAGNTYHLVISDDGNGSTITTTTIGGAPAAEPHRINVLRNVTIEAAPGTNIVLSMTATTPLNVGRHFHVGLNGSLTIGCGTASGTLALDAGAPALAGNRGGVNLNGANASLTLASGGIIRNSRAATGGGVWLTIVGTSFNMTGGSISNNTATNGAGVAVNANAVFNMTAGSISNNHATNNGGGVALITANAQFNMSAGSSINNNTAAVSGGGVALNIDNTHFTMNGGTISNNTANGMANGNGGGGVFLSAGVLSQFNFNNGSIINNHASRDGGGIFASEHTNESPLPTGSHFPQLHVSVTAMFDGNTAGRGSFEPPPNAGPPSTNINSAASHSGDYLHPLNNLDINFVISDWNRLNTLIGPNAPNPARIIIHPADSGVTPGPSGTIYNFVITDIGDGYTIITVPIVGAPATDPHRINVTRTVTIEAAPDADISLIMAGVPASPGRHFLIGASGHLTIGNPLSTGTLTIEANATNSPATELRGGIMINDGTGRLTLTTGGIIADNRAVNGGGVQINTARSAGNLNPQFDMVGGQIYRNRATTGGGGVALTVDNTHFHMSGGIIEGNNASGATSGGGGVFLATGLNSRFNFTAGTIRNNAAQNGGGVFATNFTYSDPLPANAYPQLIISASANFSGNIAHSASVPPSNAATAGITNIAATTTRSFSWHPLNNHDINFNIPGGTGDWIRLNTLIQTAILPNPQTIIIHPTGTLGPAPWPGLAADGITYNFVIEDLGDGSTIFTTSPTGAVGGVHTITFPMGRSLSILAAPGADIILSIAAATPAHPGRHFILNNDTNLNLGGIGTGTLTLNGNRHMQDSGARGGINTNANSVLNLQAGTIIRDSRAGIGGAVFLSGTSVVNMYDGVLITENEVRSGLSGAIPSSNPGGGGIATAHHAFTATFNMHGGVISNNIAYWGGGIWAMSGIVNMYDGYLIGNRGGIIGTSFNPGAGGTANPHGGGGGIRICCDGDFNMHGGVIADNASRFGGGVLLSHALNAQSPIGARFDMHGGTIRDNRASLDYINPLNLFLGWPHNEDGGGVFITSSGLFTMRDPLPGQPANTIRINDNIADNSGGGVFWNVGQWHTDERTQPVEISGNSANVDGGGIYLSYQLLEMFGEWRIDGNSANRGGGVFLHGDNSPHTYDPVLGWLPHPFRGNGHLIMHGGRIYDNKSYTSGGGVYIYNDAIFEMKGGAIDNNESAVFGGGVYVLNPGLHFTSRFDVTGGQITRNRAIYGGGVYLMFRAHMSAENVLFAGNEAERMGGAIFTELVDYGYYLSGMDVPHDILHPTPPDPNEVFQAFDNLIIEDSVRFTDANEANIYGNNSAIAAFHHPYNAVDELPNIRWLGWNTPNPRHHLSTMRHPLNNYDINFVRPVYFYKTDMGVYYPTPVINNLPGAVFALDIWNTNTSSWDFYTQATSEANGRVALLVFTPGDFRLREVTAPQAPASMPSHLFLLPPGHWYLTIASETIETVPGVFDDMLYIVDPPHIQPCTDNDLEFVRRDRETGGTPDCDDTDPARLRWHIGNRYLTAEMDLHKTDEGIFTMNPTTLAQLVTADILLEGAVFALYRYTGDGTPTASVVPAPGWVRTSQHTSTGDPDYPIELEFGIRTDQPFAYYQLVEIFAPVGYTVPFGQWRIRMNIIDVPTVNVTYVISIQGNSSTPRLVPLTGETGYVFAVGNRRNFDLPMTGGLGILSTPVMAGAGVVGGAVLLLFMLQLKKKLTQR